MIKEMIGLKERKSKIEQELDALPRKYYEECKNIFVENNFLLVLGREKVNNIFYKHIIPKIKEHQTQTYVLDSCVDKRRFPGYNIIPIYDSRHNSEHLFEFFKKELKKNGKKGIYFFGLCNECYNEKDEVAPVARKLAKLGIISKIDVGPGISEIEIFTPVGEFNLSED